MLFLAKKITLQTNLLFPFAISLLGLGLLIFNSLKFFLTKKNKDKNYQILSWFLVSLAVIEIFCNVMGFLKPGSNIFLSHFSLFLNFALLSYFFYRLIQSPVRKFIPFYFMLVVAIIAYQNIQNPETFFRFNLFEIISISVALIFYALLFIYENLDKNRGFIYFSIGLIVYFLCSSTIFLSGNLNLIFVEKPILLDVWIFNSLAFIVYQIYVFKDWKILNSDV